MKGRLLLQALLVAAHRARALLHAAVAALAAHAAARARKHQRWLAAVMHCGRQRLRRAVLLWRDAAHTAAALRRLEALEGRPAEVQSAEAHR